MEKVRKPLPLLRFSESLQYTEPKCLCVDPSLIPIAAINIERRKM